MGVHLGYLLSQPEKLRPSWLEMLKVIEEHNLRPTIRDDHIFPMTEVGEPMISSITEKILVKYY